MMQIITNCEQGSLEWRQHRMGKVTMSAVSCLLVDGRQEYGFGAGAISYCNEVVGEIITGELAGSFGGNRHTERGHEQEPEARKLYFLDTGNDVLGYELNDDFMYVESKENPPPSIILNHGAGYSPDGMIGNDGLIEIKTKLPKFMVSVICDDVVPSEHVAQCQGGLWVSEREWIDFIAYCEGMPLFVKRMYRDEVMIRKIAERVATFNRLVQERVERVMSI